MAGKNRVTRAPKAGRSKTDPGPSRASEASQFSATPGRPAPAKPTGSAARSPKRGSQVPVKPPRMKKAGTLAAVAKKAQVRRRSQGGQT